MSENISASSLRATAKQSSFLVPRFRFPEFKDNPKWVAVPLREFSVPINKRAGTNKYILMSVTSGVGLIPQIEKFGREIAGSSYKNYIVIQRGDFAYNKSATKLFPEGYIAMLSEYDEAALPNSIFTCFHIIDKEVCVNFIDHLFQSNYHGKWLRQFILVGARTHGSLNIDDKHLWEMPITLPKLQEQQKIADCLNSLDELIAAEDKKLALLKTHKKGLLQKMFPADGETVPQVRFKGYTDAWEQKQIGSVSELSIGGGTPSTSKDEYWDGNIPWLQSSDLTEHDILKVFARKHITQNGLKNSAAKLVSKNSIAIITRVGVGKLAVVPFDYTTSQDFLSLSELNMDVYFGAYSLYIRLQKDLYQVQGTSIKGITKEELLNKSIFVPLNKDEQTEIGNFFQNLDNLITTQSKKIETLKQHKKGLIQGLFPSVQ